MKFFLVYLLGSILNLLSLAFLIMIGLISIVFVLFKTFYDLVEKLVDKVFYILKL